MHVSTKRRRLCRLLPVLLLCIGISTVRAEVFDVIEGTVIIEAESFAESTPGDSHQWVTQSESSASGGAFITTTPDKGTLLATEAGSPSVEYSIRFSAAGTYYVWVRGSGDTNASGEGRSDSVHVGVDGKIVASADKIDRFPSGWHWSNQTRDPHVATILIDQPGIHSVSLWMREDGLAIDQLALTSSVLWTPDSSDTDVGDKVTDTVLPTARTVDSTYEKMPENAVYLEQDGIVTLEAEWFHQRQNTSTHQWEESADTGASNGALMLTTPDAGALKRNSKGSPMLSYQVRFESGGLVRVWVRGRGDTNQQGRGKSDSLHVGLNGQLVQSAAAMDQFPAEWSWSSHTQNESSAVLSVPSAGVHTVNLWMREDGLEVDKVILMRDRNVAPLGAGPAVVFEESDNGGVSAVNQAPQVFAGADQISSFDEPVRLEGRVLDDGLPVDRIDVEWTSVSGPAAVWFEESANVGTTAYFSVAGRYTLRLQASDGERQGSDTLTVTVLDTLTGGTINAGTRWQVLQTVNNSAAEARHEAGAVRVGDDLYLMGGRNKRRVNRYEAVSRRWQRLSLPPMEIHHFQPVAIDRTVYVLGAFTCCFPRESIVPGIYAYDTRTDRWSSPGVLPRSRMRGSAGAVVYNGKIYLIGGNTKGHAGGAVAWFDEYDPVTGQWTTLPDAPNARDHFQAVMIGNLLIAAGGRRTSQPNTFANTETDVDIYDFSTGRWRQGRRLPTARAGTMSVGVGNEVLVIGGESAARRNAHDDVEAYDVLTNTWRSLQPLQNGRHSGGAALLDDGVHVVAGALTRGGSRESAIQERLPLQR